MRPWPTGSLARPQGTGSSGDGELSADTVLLGTAIPGSGLIAGRRGAMLGG
ncbi:hypothetical protein BH23VER1_BH23VER1_26320 [soil metagenome]